MGRFTERLEIILPLILGLVILSFFSHVLYEGNNATRLASQAERFLIKNSLLFSSREAKEVTRIKVIASNPAGALGELNHLINSSTRTYLFLNSEADLGQVIRLLTTYPDRLYLVYPLAEISELPSWLRRDPRVLCGAGCGVHLQHYAAYQPNDPRRPLTGNIAALFWPQEPPKFKLSAAVPLDFPAYILNLPELKKGQRLLSADLTSVIKSSDKADWPLVFIGSSSQTDFFARLAQMFMDDATISVPPPWVIVASLILINSIIIFLLWRVGAIASLGIFLFYSSLYPAINTALVKYLNIYIPVFHLIYGGLLTFLVATFWQLSMQVYRRIHYDAQSRLFSDEAITKGNLVALMSHNLNTPVARMNGLFDIIWATKFEKDMQIRFRNLRKEIARLQLCIKAVLKSSKIEDDAMTKTFISLRAFKSAFEDSARSTLDKFRIEISFVIVNDDNEANLIPFSLDVSSLCQTLSMTASLFGSLTDAKVTIEAQIKEEERERQALIFKVRGENNRIGFRAKDMLTTLNTNSLSHRSQDGVDFFEVVSINLLKVLVTHYNGQVYFEEDPLAQTITVKIYPD